MRIAAGAVRRDAYLAHFAHAEFYGDPNTRGEKIKKTIPRVESGGGKEIAGVYDKIFNGPAEV